MWWRRPNNACATSSRRCSRRARRLSDVVRVTYIVPNAADFKPTWPVLRKYFGDIRPAATMISAGLADPRMKIEIEVTARRSRERLTARRRRGQGLGTGDQGPGTHTASP